MLTVLLKRPSHANSQTTLTPTLHQPRCSSPDTVQNLNVLFVVRGPKLNQNLRCGLTSAECKGMIILLLLLATLILIQVIDRGMFGIHEKLTEIFEDSVQIFRLMLIMF